MALEPDAQLMLQVRGGDVASFELLLVRHRTPVIRYLTRMTGNQGVAEELAQEVFLRVYRARDGYEPTAKFTTWLYRIATRLALNSIRDRKPERNQRSLDDSGLDDSDGQPMSTADADEGGNDTFFAWFFRGKGPRGVVSGANIQRRFITRGAVYATFFEDNHVADLLACRPDQVEGHLTALLGGPSPRAMVGALRGGGAR